MQGTRAAKRVHLALPALIAAAFIGYAVTPASTPVPSEYALLVQGLPGRTQVAPGPVDVAALRRAKQFILGSQSFYVTAAPTQLTYVLGVVRTYLSPAQAVQSPRDADWVVEYGPGAHSPASGQVTQLDQEVTIVKVR